MVRQGHENTKFYECQFDREAGKTTSCNVMTSDPLVAENDSVVKQVSGAVGSAANGALVGDGIRDAEGDNTTVNNASNSEGYYEGGPISVTATGGNGCGSGSGESHPGCGNSGNC